MGLFKRKNDSYSDASANLNGSSKVVDKIVFEQLSDDDEAAKELAEKLKAGCPLVLNFENLDKDCINKYLGFFAGVAWACDGKSVAINKDNYLFARRIDFIDGSLMEFIRNLGE